jgi:hypothetical protein
VWQAAIKDTLKGETLKSTAEGLSLSHNAMFNMRHKILQGMEEEAGMKETILEGVCEIDDTYVLENQKGKRLPEGYWRKARKHGAKAVKCGISDEYIDISCGVGRETGALCRSVNRATASYEDMKEVFAGHIAGNALVICDGEKSYQAVSEACGCALSNVDNTNAFYNINTVNSFHSMLKERYRRYRGVATKYLNRYNTLFADVFRNPDMECHAGFAMMKSGAVNYYHSQKDVKRAGLLTL